MCVVYWSDIVWKQLLKIIFTLLKGQYLLKSDKDNCLQSIITYWHVIHNYRDKYIYFTYLSWGQCRCIGVLRVSVINELRKTGRWGWGYILNRNDTLFNSWAMFVVKYLIYNWNKTVHSLWRCISWVPGITSRFPSCYTYDGSYKVRGGIS